MPFGLLRKTITEFVSAIQFFTKTVFLKFMIGRVIFVFLVFLVSNVCAQTDTTKSGFDLSIISSFPLGVYADTDIFDSEAGFANFGMGA